ALVAFVDLRQRLFKCRDPALCLVLDKPATSACLGFGGEKKFDVCVWKHDAPDVASLKHASVLGRQAYRPLMLDHYPADFRDRRNDGGCLCDVERAYLDRDVVAVEHDLHRIRLADQLDPCILCDLGDPHL